MMRGTSEEPSFFQRDVDKDNKDINSGRRLIEELTLE